MMKYLYSKTNAYGTWLLAATWLLGSMLLPGACSRLYAQEPDSPDEVIELSPFLVNPYGDKGYRAANTLSGSRLNSSLGDTAASVSVFTELFIEDLGITDIDELMRYSMSTVGDIGDADNANGLVNQTFNATSLTRKIRTRGISSSKGLDYFESITPDDSYRVGRYDESRGPNGILFGVSNAGGITNQTSIAANTQRDSGKISIRLTAESGLRQTIRLNRVLIENRLGFVFSGLNQEETGWRDGDYKDKERVFGAVTFKANDRLTLRANYESGHDRRALIKPITVRDEAMAWWDNVQAGNPNTLVYPWRKSGSNNSASNRSDAQLEAGIGGATGANRFVYIVNDGVLLRTDRTNNTVSYNNSGVLSPDGVPGRSGTSANINDPSFVPYEINTIGTAGWRDTKIENYTYFADYKITDNFFVNVAHNYQRTVVDFPFVNGNNPKLRGDPNITRGAGTLDDVILDDDGVAIGLSPDSELQLNPYAGMLYFESDWKRDFHEGDRDETRISLSYDLNTERFGSHRFGAMIGRANTFDVRSSKYLVFEGGPGNANITAGANRIRMRHYIEDPSNIADWKQADWRDLPETLPYNGVELPLVWGNANPGNTNTAAGTEIDTMLAVSQSHFMNRKLILTLGYREDSATFARNGHTWNEKVGWENDFNVVEFESKFSGQTQTAGLVYNVNEQLGLIVNTGTSIGLPDFIRSVLPYGTVPDPSENEGSDLGIKFDLLDRRISGRFVYYDTEAIRRVGGGNFRNFNNEVIDNIGVLLTTDIEEDGVIVSPAEYTTEQWDAIVDEGNLRPYWNAGYQDAVSSGYELSLNANVTDNWRLTMNASKNDRIATGTFSAAIDYFGFAVDDAGHVVEAITDDGEGGWIVDRDAFTEDGVIARWFGFLDTAGLDFSEPIGEDGDPLALELLDVIDSINEKKDSEEKRWGLRPYKVNLFTAYDFDRGFLKGFTVGGGYRWQSANIMGEDSEGNEIEGLPNTAADFMLRYRIKLDGQFNGRLTLQLNVSNVFDAGPIIPRRFSSDPDFYVPGGETPTSRGVAMSRFDLVEPRSYRFTTSVSF